MNSPKTPEYDLSELERKASLIVKQELRNEKKILRRMVYFFAKTKVEVYGIKTVGVQGDNRTYEHPVEIEIRFRGKIIYHTDLAKRIGTRIPNKIKGINRVIFTIL